MADDEPSLVCDILSIHEPKLESLEPPGLPFSACRQLASALLSSTAVTRLALHPWGESQLTHW